MPEGVPEDDVGVLDWAVCLRPLEKTVGAAALVGVLAGGIALMFVERRDPDMMFDEAGALAPPGRGRTIGQRVSPPKKR